VGFSATTPERTAWGSQLSGMTFQSPLRPRP